MMSRGREAGRKVQRISKSVSLLMIITLSVFAAGKAATQGLS